MRGRQALLYFAQRLAQPQTGLLLEQNLGFELGLQGCAGCYQALVLVQPGAKFGIMLLRLQLLGMMERLCFVLQGSDFFADCVFTLRPFMLLLAAFL